MTAHTRIVIVAAARCGAAYPVTVVLMWTILLPACTKQAAPSSPSRSTAESDSGPPPAIPTTEGATLRLSDAGVLPKQVRIYQDSRVTFVNDDIVNHEVASNPLHVHTDCPELNVGVAVPGESRVSGPLKKVGACGFHDHLREGDVRYYGTVFVDSR